MFEKRKRQWITLSVVNLMIVAILGLTLRSKILFSIPFLDFKHVLHAHSHFAFGGWVSLALLTLMSYELLPDTKRAKTINTLLWLITINAFGMLISFIFQGYGLYSILFSTVFIFTTYVYAWIFIKEIKKISINKTIKLLSTAAVIYMALSSVGPFTLAYLLAGKSGNIILYKDAVYTYLHLQYNGFFTMGILAIMFNKIIKTGVEMNEARTYSFANMLNISIIPSLFLCYLWHYPNIPVRIVSIIGALTVLLSFIQLTILLKPLNKYANTNSITFKYLFRLSFLALMLKLVLQSLTVFPAIGEAVFNNRPVIIGFLHLVLLCFVTLYIIAHYIQTGIFKDNGITNLSIIVFTAGVLINELVLMVQGLEIMLMANSVIFTWLLWYAAICLFLGSFLLLIARGITIVTEAKKTLH